MYRPSNGTTVRHITDDPDRPVVGVVVQPHITDYLPMHVAPTFNLALIVMVVWPDRRGWEFCDDIAPCVAFDPRGAGRATSAVVDV